MDKALKKASSLMKQQEKQLGLPLEDSLIFTSSDFFLHLVEELSDSSSRLLWAIIARIEKGDTSSCVYEFTNKEILDQLDIDTKHGHSRLKAIFKELIACSVIIGADDEKGADRLRNIFDGVDFQRYSRTVSFKFRPELDPYLFNIENTSIRAVLKYAHKLSKRAGKLYFMLVSQFKTQDRKVSLEFLRSYLGVEDTEYPRFYDFKKRILNPLVEEVSEKADIVLTWEPVKEGRVTKSIYFSYTEKYPEQSPRRQRSLDKPQTEGQGGDIESFISSEMGLDKKQAGELIEAYTEEDIRGAYSLGISRIKNKNMRKSRGGYFSKSAHDLVSEYQDTQKNQIKEQRDLLATQEKVKIKESSKAKEKQEFEAREEKVRDFLLDLEEEKNHSIREDFLSNTPSVKVLMVKKNIHDMDVLATSYLKYEFVSYIENTYSPGE